MKFEDFLKAVIPKINAGSAFDMARDVRIKALEQLLVSKGVATQMEINNFIEAEFDRMAEVIRKMPEFPKG
ncbi:MAG: hypothetical protein HYY10_00860 [Candidatus Liptonbacteria bacterium]|nr:hypothetical protein [Candidatus Liptonbacteria bacterium]